MFLLFPVHFVEHGGTGAVVDLPPPARWRTAYLQAAPPPGGRQYVLTIQTAGCPATAHLVSK